MPSNRFVIFSPHKLNSWLKKQKIFNTEKNDAWLIEDWVTSKMMFFLSPVDEMMKKQLSTKETLEDYTKRHACECRHNDVVVKELFRPNLLKRGSFLYNKSMELIGTNKLTEDNIEIVAEQMSCFVTMCEVWFNRLFNILHSSDKICVEEAIKIVAEDDLFNL